MDHRRWRMANFPKRSIPTKRVGACWKCAKFKKNTLRLNRWSLLLLMEKQLPNELILRGAMITYPDKLRQQFIGAIAEYLMMKMPCHPV